LDEIARYEGDQVNINEAKERLAYEQTKIIHGVQEADKAREAAKALFGGSLSSESREGLPSITISATLLESGIGAIELFAMTDLCKNNSDARRLIQQGGALVGERKVEDVQQIIDTSWANQGEMILRAGKKRYFRVVIES
jgi:tyrosyl-tRNA synthetase